MPTDPQDAAATEASALRYRGLETWPPQEIISALLDGQLAATAAAMAARDRIVTAQQAALPRLAGGGRLVYAGAGTSGRLAALDAAELEPTFGWPRDRALLVMAGGAEALTRAIEGAEDDHRAGAQRVAELGVGPQDVVLALAASGRTPFTCAVVVAARALGALTIGIANSPESPLARAADIAIEIDTGAEPVAGSTRMKAGTAQKAVLSCLSTAIMLGLGLVWQGRMVGMRPTNAKLRTRAEAMVADLAGVSGAVAATTLRAADDRIAVAVLMLLRDLDAQGATRRLDSAGGRLGDALDIAED